MNLMDVVGKFSEHMDTSHLGDCRILVPTHLYTYYLG